MSFLLPFEVQTDRGWKQAGDLKEGDTVLCLEKEHGLVHKRVRQCIVYDSNFAFTEFSNGPFQISICDGHPISPFFYHSMPCSSSAILQLKCKEEVEEGAYNPDPDFVCAGALGDIDGLQLEAVSKGIHTVVEHRETPQIRVTEMPFAPVAAASKVGR